MVHHVIELFDFLRVRTIERQGSKMFFSFENQPTRIALVCGSSFSRMTVSQPATRNSLPSPCSILSTTNLI